MLKARHLLDVKKKQIEDNLVSLANQVKEAMEQAVMCLRTGDKTVCSAIIAGDEQINESRRLIEHDCLLAIALHQPVAHDLREIAAASRIAGELERTADYASDIAAINLQMDGADLSEIGVDSVLKMASLSAHMLDEVIKAYLHRDAKKAKKAAAIDDEIDTEQANLIGELFTVMQSRPAHVPNASRVLWVSHNLERCGDRATNIAEQVVFMLEAKVVELD